MSELDLERRGLIAAAVLGVAGLTAAPALAAAPGPAFEAKPLPFDPTSIAGLSDKLLISHHDNNYVGAVKRLGAITAEVAGLDPTTAPGYRINGLKREELIAWNSMILHEIYFAGLGPPTPPGRVATTLIERDFGSFERWQAEFVAMGKARGGGSGWVVLTWSHRDQRLVNQWAADHTMALADSTPVLVLDMYEHAYAIDYGAKAAAYVDAFMQVIDWRNAGRILGRAAAT